MHTFVVSIAVVLCLAACTQPSSHRSDTASPAAQPMPAAPALTEPGLQLSGHDWVLTELAGQPLAAELEATASAAINLRIDQQHIDDATAKLSGFDGCNRFMASAALGDGLLRVGPIGASKMYCQATSDFAQRYHQQLRAVAGYEIQDRALHLHDAAGKTLLSYRLP